MVIADDRAIRKVLNLVFEPEEFVVEIARDKEACLSAFRAAPPAMVVLDLRFPDLSGLDLCRALRKEAETLPIIVLSTGEELVEMLLAGLRADCVMKPFSPRDLLAHAKAVLRGPRSPRGTEQLVPPVKTPPDAWFYPALSLAAHDGG